VRDFEETVSGVGRGERALDSEPNRHDNRSTNRWTANKTFFEQEPAMKSRRLATFSVVGLLILVGAVRAEVKVEMKGLHLCCAACEKSVNAIVEKVDGVKATCDRRKKTVTLTAADNASAQKAVDALVAGGFHGTTDSKDVTVKEEAPAVSGKVQSLTIEGIHNCCGACCTAIKQATKKVEGVTGDTAKPRSPTFEVTGDFDAAELVKALEAAGFHVKVKK
jgi:copper chaperone CopZ